MPQKKPKRKSARHQTTLRFDAAEMAQLEIDREAVNNGGPPVKFGAYAKHAVLSYPKLRALEAELRSDAVDAVANGSSADPESRYAKKLLEVFMEVVL